MRIDQVVQRASGLTARLALAVSILARTRHPASRRNATDLRVRQLNDVLQLQVLWIDRPGEIGPSYSVFAGRAELLRVDLFDEGAHLHPVFVALRGIEADGRRQYLFEEGREQILERGCAELRHNLHVHLSGHPLPHVRRSLPSQEELDAAADWLHATMGELNELHR